MSSNRADEPGQGERVRARFVSELVDEETGELVSDEQRQAALESMAEMVRWPPAVIVALREIEAVTKKWPADVGRQALASALWRALSGMAGGEQLWFESVMLRDGGRRMSFELLALFSKEPR